MFETSPRQKLRLNETPSMQSSNSKQKFLTARAMLPDMGDFFFLFCFLFPIRLLPEYLFTDGSTGWHLATGHYILNTGSFPTTEFMSYTRPGQPWLPLYWLWDYLMAVFDRAGGLNALAVFCSALIAMLGLLVYKRMRAAGCHALIALAAVFIGAVASTVHWLARPVIATFLGVYFLSTCLEDFYEKRISWKACLLLGSLIMLLWVNSHPAFVSGYAMIAIYLGVCLAESFLAPEPDKRAESLGKSKWLLLLLLLCALVTLINPFGIGLPQNVFQYLGQIKILDSVDEYKSPVFHGQLQMTALEILFLMLLLGLFIRKGIASLPHFALTAGFFHLTLNAVRNIPLFAYIALPFMGTLYGSSHLADWTAKAQAAGGLAGALARIWSRADQIFNEGEQGPKLHLLPIATVLIFFIASLSGGRLFGQELLNCKFPSSMLPTTTLNFLNENDFKKHRGFNHVNWGGYIFYKAGIPIFIDDRSAFFGEDFYTEYGKIVSLWPGWKQLLENKHKIDWVIFPKNQPLSGALKADPDWQLVAEDQAAYVFVRKSRRPGN